MQDNNLLSSMFLLKTTFVRATLLNNIFIFVSNYCKHLLIMNYSLLAWLLSDEALVFLKDKMCSVSLYFPHPKYSVIQAKINVNHRSWITHSISHNDHIAFHKGEAKGMPLAQQQVCTRKIPTQVALLTSRVSCSRAGRNQGCNNFSWVLFKKVFMLLCLLSRSSFWDHRVS